LMIKNVGDRRAEHRVLDNEIDTAAAQEAYELLAYGDCGDVQL